MAATLKSIAEECGVSAQTVSRILNPEYVHLYKKETCELVKHKAEELGYRPNAAAKAMKSGSFKSVLLLQSSNPAFSHVTSEVFYSIQNTLSSLDYKLICGILPEDRKSAEIELAKTLRESFVDGILVTFSRAIPGWLERLLDNINIPVFWIGSQHKHNCICHNDFQAGYDITRKFIELGHKNIAYTDFAFNNSEVIVWHFSVNDRMNGYLKAIEEAGYQPMVIRPDSEIPVSNMVKYAEENLIKKNRPTAVVSYGLDPTGRSIMYALCRNGLKVPDDMSLATFCYKEEAENDMNISAFVPSKKDIGKISAELIYDKILNRKLHPEPIALPFDFYEGDTIAPPKG